MTTQPPSSRTEIICIGSVLWDIIGRAQREMRQGSDVPGRITRLPGGVALNIAMTLAGFGLRPILLSAVGRDAAGDELLRACAELGTGTEHIFRPETLPTDQYLAVEGANGLIAAIADAHSLEAAGAEILSPLLQGPLGHSTAPYGGLIALDGNLTTELLDLCARHDAFAAADLRIAPASPGKAERLLPFLTHERGTLYVNLEEAGLLCGTVFEDAATAAQGLVDQGAARALVTDGDRLAADCSAQGQHSAHPPRITPRRITGAGDTFMAAHIAAETQNLDRPSALEQALEAAAKYVSGDSPT